MVHAAVALLLQAAIALATGDWWLGAALGVGLFAGREHAQAEYRWIEHYGSGRRANMPWYGGFQPKAWTGKAVLDVVLASAAVVAVAIGAQP
tara:strand:+ start:1000 stop:1275 length:276 start_codon:yes stop_codon:yes gene_type:complete